MKFHLETGYVWNCWYIVLEYFEFLLDLNCCRMIDKLIYGSCSWEIAIFSQILCLIESLIATLVEQYGHSLMLLPPQKSCRLL